MVEDSVIRPGFTPEPELDEVLVLSAAGEKALATVSDAIPPEATEADVKLALLALLGGRQDYIAYGAVDAQRVMEVLAGHIAKGEIRHPYPFGDFLYDQFLDLRVGPSPEPDDHVVLDASESQVFLQGTPIGIAQLGHVLAGPLGISIVRSSRFLPPSTSARAYHCLDVGCLETHPVTLTTSETFASQIYETIRNSWDAHDWLSSWRSYRKLLADVNEPFAFDPFDSRSIIWLLGQCFSEDEIRSVLTALVDLGGADFRREIGKTSRGDSLREGSALDIVDSLQSHSDLMHFAMIANDMEIVSAIEKCISSRTVDIPMTEIRMPQEWIGAPSYYRPWPNASVRGVRFSPTQRAAPMDCLRELFIYAFQDDQPSLEWFLRFEDAEAGDRLTSKLFDLPPRDAVYGLLQFPDKFHRVSDFLRFGDAVTAPRSPEQEEELVDRVLWRLGFDLAAFPVETDALEKHVRSLRVVVAGARASGVDVDREGYRSVAVNLFVALEEVLHDAIVFVAWVLFRDHFESGLSFSREESIALGHATLNRALSSAGTDSRIPSSGRVTLGPLIECIPALASLIEQTSQASTKQRRPASELPEAAKRAQLGSFAFFHKQALDDVRVDDVTNLIQRLRELHRLLVRRVDIPWVRNCVDHHRPEFPTSEQFGLVCDVIDAALQLMSNSRIYPYAYYRDRTVSDRFGRRRRILVNRYGDEVEIRLPQPVFLGVAQNLDAPVVLSPFRMRDSSLPLAFNLVEPSTYRALMARRPRRRLPPESRKVDASGAANPS